MTDDIVSPDEIVEIKPDTTYVLMFSSRNFTYQAAKDYAEYINKEIKKTSPTTDTIMLWGEAKLKSLDEMIEVLVNEKKRLEGGDDDVD